MIRKDGSVNDHRVFSVIDGFKVSSSISSFLEIFLEMSFRCLRGSQVDRGAVVDEMRHRLIRTIVRVEHWTFRCTTVRFNSFFHSSFAYLEVSRYFDRYLIMRTYFSVRFFVCFVTSGQDRVVSS